MSCEAPIPLETLLRNSLRVVDGEALCAAVLVNAEASEGVLGCDPAPLHTQLSMAMQDGVNTAITSGTPIDCDAPPLYTMLMGAVHEAASGRTIMVVPVSAQACDHSCADSELPTSELITRAMVATSTGYAVQVMVDDDAELLPLDCENEYPTETLLRAALTAVGDGTYAFRVQTK